MVEILPKYGQHDLAGAERSRIIIIGMATGVDNAIHIEVKIVELGQKRGVANKLFKTCTTSYRGLGDERIKKRLTWLMRGYLSESQRKNFGTPILANLSRGIQLNNLILLELYVNNVCIMTRGAISRRGFPMKSYSTDHQFRCPFDRRALYRRPFDRRPYDSSVFIIRWPYYFLRWPVIVQWVLLTPTREHLYIRPFQ